jgi:hypothetical protein
VRNSFDYLPPAVPFFSSGDAPFEDLETVFGIAQVAETLLETVHDLRKPWLFRSPEHTDASRINVRHRLRVAQERTDFPAHVLELSLQIPDRFGTGHFALLVGCIPPNKEACKACGM